MKRRAFLAGSSALAIAASVDGVLAFPLIPGGAGTGGGGGPTTIQTFTINNADTNPLPATALWSFYRTFARAAVPSGKTVQALVGGASYPLGVIPINTYPNGDLKQAQLTLNISGLSLAGGSSATLQLQSVTGARTSSSSRTTADWTALADTLEVTVNATSGASGVGMNKAGTYIGAFDAGATNNVIVWGDCTNGKIWKVRCKLVNTGDPHTFMTGWAEYFSFENAGVAGPVMCRFQIRNAYGYLLDPGGTNGFAQFTYDLTWKRGGVAQQTITGIQQEPGTGSWIAHSRGDGQGIWTANEPIIYLTESIAQFTGTRQVPPYITSTTYNIGGGSGVGQVVTTISTTTGSVTCSQNKFVTAFGTNAQPVPFRMTAAAMPTGLSAATTYWAQSTGTNSFDIYDTRDHGSLANSPAWVGGGTYTIGQVRKNDTNPYKFYKCTTGGMAAGSGGPTGTGTGIVDGTVVWDYVTAPIVPSTTGTSVLVYHSYAPMGFGTATIALGSGGNRADIALLPEWDDARILGTDSVLERQRWSRTNAMAYLTTSRVCVLETTDRIPNLSSVAHGALTPTKQTHNWRATANRVGIPPWTTTDTFVQACDMTHFPNLSYLTYILEGGPLNQDSVIFGGNQSPGTSAVKSVSVPGGATWPSVIINSVNPRESAWSFRNLLYAANCTNDGSDEQAYFKALVKMQGDFFADVMANASANFLLIGAFGLGILSSNSCSEANYQNFYFGQTTCLGLFMFSDDSSVNTNLLGLANHQLGVGICGFYQNGLGYFTTSYRDMKTQGTATADLSTYVGSWNDVGFAAGSSQLAAYNAGTGVVTTSGGAPFIGLANGDKFMPIINDMAIPGSGPAPPTPLVEGTWYYIRGISGTNPNYTFQLETSPGAADINSFGSSPSNCRYTWHTFQTAPSNTGPNDPTGPAGYEALARAAVAMGCIAGVNNCATVWAEANSRNPTNFNNTAGASVCQFAFQNA